MASHAVIDCFQQADKWFTGVVVTNGSGSPRDALYKNYTDEQMQLVRRKEQKKAAEIGEYAALAFLDFPSSAVKDAANTGPVRDLAVLLEKTRPDIVCTHNLADKHDTHVGVALRTVEAIRSLPPEHRPKKVLGCEVWRSLDWMHDDDKLALDTSRHANLQAALLGVYDSQIAGGKRYDLAAIGRRRANATFHQSHDTDTAEGLTFAMDLTPLIHDDEQNPLSLVTEYIERFQQDVSKRLEEWGRPRLNRWRFT